MKQFYFNIKTNGRGFTHITAQINHIISELKIENGMCHIFLQHTSASLILCENADSQVLQDLENFVCDFIKDGDPRFLHNEEGPDDMPAHIRTILTQNSLSIPIVKKSLALGTWQGIFLWEHRLKAQKRQIILTVY